MKVKLNRKQRELILSCLRSKESDMSLDDLRIMDKIIRSLVPPKDFKEAFPTFRVERGGIMWKNQQ